MNVKVNRRKFLKMLGWGGAGTALAGCDMPTTVTLEEGKEEVVSYLMPEEYVVPGIGVWYASTCTQCEAGCGLHGRVREGRVLKLEGNPDSPINHGKTCMMGQAGLQAHYNPDRITAPMMRKGGSLQAVSWDDAMAELAKRIGPSSGVDGKRVGMITGTISGHQSVLVNDFLGQLGSKNHYVHEVINSSVWRSVCRDMLGDETPKLNFDKARVVLSFGADFMGTWGSSPVHNMGEYAKFRKGDERGTLIQIEPKMTMTGANADLWMPVTPGTEGALALGVANFIIDRGWNLVDVPARVRATLKQYDLDTVQKVTGVNVEKIERIASLLSERSPSMILAGAPVEGQENGYDSVAAIMLLNLIMGNVGNTIDATAKFAEASMRPKQGGTKDLLLLAKALNNKKLDVLISYNTNPVFTAPDVLQLQAGLANVGFKVAFSMFPDETTLSADLVLPIRSNTEDWGTHVAAYQPDGAVMGFQQPLMEPLHKETRGFGDIMLSLLKLRSKDYAKFEDYYAFLQTSLLNMPSSIVASTGSKEETWNSILQTGLVKTKGITQALKPKLVDMRYKPSRANSEYPMQLIPSTSLGLWDGRHANLPWIQEAPDTISKVVWGSWAEIHPKKAAELGVKNGDYVQITSASGTIETQVYVYKGIHPDAIAVPVGQGHDEYGRYAKGRGVNSLKILNPLMEKRTGELATHATRVKVANAHRKEPLVKMGSSEVQVGRKFVRTISSSVLRRTEKEA